MRDIAHFVGVLEDQGLLDDIPFFEPPAADAVPHV